MRSKFANSCPHYSHWTIWGLNLKMHSDVARNKQLKSCNIIQIIEGKTWLKFPQRIASRNSILHPPLSPPNLLIDFLPERKGQMCPAGNLISLEKLKIHAQNPLGFFQSGISCPKNKIVLPNPRFNLIQSKCISMQ